MLLSGTKVVYQNVRLLTKLQTDFASYSGLEIHRDIFTRTRIGHHRLHRHRR